MTLKLPVFLLAIAALQSCTGNNNPKSLKDSLQKRDATIALLQQQLKAKDDSLNLLKKAADSTIALQDTGVYNPALVGLWSVKMQCIETSCDGSAIGDVKNEQWKLSYEGTSLIAEAYTDKKVTRVYRGTLKNNQIELKTDEASGNTLITVSLQEGSGQNKLEGVREIVRGEECRIRYSVNLEKL
ncbi:MAG: hypothetical protein K0S09_573 [Sphingobacteriaceae bacterium]|jgi:hypothetical protein|nr:hypothetical protein [Sphingobacteriaceae bacterium]